MRFVFGDIQMTGVRETCVLPRSSCSTRCGEKLFISKLRIFAGFKRKTNDQKYSTVLIREFKGILKKNNNYTVTALGTNINNYYRGVFIN